MRQILLVCALMLWGCQRLRLEVDDLRLRCGEDANLVDVAQWVEPFSAYGKPTSNLVKAALVRDDLVMEKLPISSKGCVAVPANAASWRWLVVRSEGGGNFGKVLEASPERYRRVQLEAIPSSFPRFDCPSPASNSALPIKINYSERFAAENLILSMSLLGEKDELEAQLKLELARQEGDTHSFDLTPIKEGKFAAKIRLISLLDIHNNLKGFERTCPLRIDRTPPQAKIVLRNGREALLDGRPLRLNPGESLEVSSSDASTTKVLSCWGENRGASAPCSNFVEAGSRLSAPSEGEWTLAFTVVDEAGNKAPLKELNVAIFDADRVGRIVEWIELAKAYLKEDNNYDALQQIYRAARAMTELKAKSEWQYIRNRLRIPFLKLLPRVVPMQRVQNEEGILDKIWGTSDSTFLTHSFGERRWGHIVKQFDLNGKLLK
ncbi:MAG TPA: hypothetical protein VFO10_19260, partial [Oligoflexus sp.]|uniref:hypothetical protein n=1 Tax=Oligoflexus sp. TaxID=1971216 RepID=UPI002D7F738C